MVVQERAEGVVVSVTPATTDADGVRPVGFVRRYWWLLRSVLLTALNVLVFVFLSFFLVKLIPGDPVVTATGGRLTGEALEEARASYGLTGSIGEQLAAYLSSLARFDLGTSIATGRPIAADLATRIPATLELVLLGLVAASVLALLLSHYVVTHRANRVSQTLMSYARSAGALPEYVIGIAFLYIFFAVLGWAPAPSGRLDPMLIAPPSVTGFPVLDAIIAGDSAATSSYLSRLALPVLVMMVAHAPILMKMLIVNLDQAIDDPATRFRIASGAPRAVVLVSIYRRALPAAVAMLGMMFGLLLGGAVVLESLFALGGLGQYAVDAVNASDVFALRSFLLVTAVMCLLIYLVVDVATMLLDPRRRVGTGRAS